MSANSRISIFVDEAHSAINSPPLTFWRRVVQRKLHCLFAPKPSPTLLLRQVLKLPIELRGSATII